MMNTSASSLPSEIIPVTADITAAIISTIIIGFLNCSMNLASKVGLGGSSSLFCPTFSRRFAASSLVSPAAVLSTSFRTASVDSR